jgi:hypothetical protein
VLRGEPATSPGDRVVDLAQYAAALGQSPGQPHGAVDHAVAETGETP